MCTLWVLMARSGEAKYLTSGLHTCLVPMCPDKDHLGHDDCAYTTRLTLAFASMPCSQSAAYPLEHATSMPCSRSTNQQSQTKPFENRSLARQPFAIDMQLWLPTFFTPTLHSGRRLPAGSTPSHQSVSIVHVKPNKLNLSDICFQPFIGPKATKMAPRTCVNEECRSLLATAKLHTYHQRPSEDCEPRSRHFATTTGCLRSASI